MRDLHRELEAGGPREVYHDPHAPPTAHGAGTHCGEATFHIPGDLPLGFHEIHMSSPEIGSYSCPLIITPARLTTADPYLDKPAAGVMAQLYSVRSAQSW